MFSTACPSCGAPVAFKSAASVMAVCEYCRATLLREADAVKDIGKMSAVLEDYSPIQITTQGLFEGRSFAVVGRIQLRFDAGFWNEWHVLFDDGRSGWLSDASGQYALTVDDGLAEDAPAFDSLHPGQLLNHDGQPFAAADIRSARCTGGEGELPFRVGEGWEAKVADFRQRRRFLTLDYSDGHPPRRYLGKSVDLKALKCQLLRSDEQILQRAGRLRGKIAPLECPGCGGQIPYPAGAATQLVCPACGTRSDVSGEQAVVLGKQAELDMQSAALELGAVANINGIKYTVIGLLRCDEPGEDESWDEYLLYNPQRGFLWLVESSAGWERVEVLDDWPVPVSNTSVQQGDQTYTRQIEYRSRVRHAAGAFNWQVKAGDTVRITDWQAGSGVKLSLEESDAEQVWSKATRVSPAQLGRWFGPDKIRSSTVSTAAGSSGSSQGKPIAMAVFFSIALLMFNGPIAAFADGSWELTLIALFVLWWPLIPRQQESE